VIRFLADENFNNHIIRGIQLRQTDIDIVRVQDVGLSSEDDSVIIDFAFKDEHILLTHDVETIPRFAYERLKSGHSIPSIFIIS
jgi:predicted nuclease of predicted toxin-antitoxin system